jgi:hypothetical protein
VGDPGPEPPIDPCKENQEAEDCTSEPPLDPCEENPEAEECILPDPCVEDPTTERCEPPVCSCPPGERQDCPDIDCDPCKEIHPYPNVNRYLSRQAEIAILHILMHVNRVLRQT